MTLTFFLSWFTMGALVALFVLLRRSNPFDAERVIKIYGGGTFSIHSMGAWRECILTGIMVPEVGEPYGEEARAYFQKLVSVCEKVAIYRITPGPEDRFAVMLWVDHPTLGHIDVGRQVLKKGLALPHNPHKEIREDYLLCRDTAKGMKKGIWESGIVEQIGENHG